MASTVVEEDKEFVMEQWVEPVSEALDIINNAIPSKSRTALKPAIIENKTMLTPLHPLQKPISGQPNSKMLNTFLSAFENKKDQVNTEN